MRLPIAIQLYTLRDELDKDFIGTLEKVAKIGYEGVEFAGYGNIPATTMKSHLERLNLKVAGAHVSLERLQNTLLEEIEYNKIIGNKYIVCPWTKFETMQQYLECAALLEGIGTTLKHHGLELVYHNHAHEFELFGGMYGLDILFSNTIESTLKAEIDTYWVEYANVNSTQYLKKLTNRCPLIHQKDMDNTTKRGFTELGTGVLDLKKMYRTYQEIGVEWYIVEQDECTIPPLESIEISYNNLKKMGLA